MAAPIVNQAPPVAARTDALVRRVAELSRWPAGGGGDGLALGLVDAVLDADATSLGAVLAALREARAGADEGADERLAGWLDAAIALVYWSLERITPEATLGGVARGTRAFDFLSAVGERPGVGSAELRELLETDETQVSRTGRQLLERGLASRRKAGRQALWDLTPRGRRTLELVAARPPEPAPAPAPDSFWMEAIRRGFAGAGGDEPGLRREVDPTRERIVETTLELHNLQGIVDTTVADIARSAGVPVETVEAYFPTQDDLIKGCGQHVLESLRLPPPEAAPVIFEGTQGASDRVRRLVETLFETYERAGVSLEGGRRVRVELPLVGESMDQVDIALDALVREALGPDRSNEAVAAVGALTDVSVWRALRELGVSPEHSVEKAALTVDAWLEGATVKAAPAP